MLWARPARAQEADFRRVSDYAWFLLGAASGLVLHESGHLIMDYSLGADPTLVPVKLGPFPFFAIQPRNIRSNQDRYAITVAGFSAQDLWSELTLGFCPRLKSRHHPFLKGMLALHIGLSIGYAITGFANVGPQQSDVNNMAFALGVPQWVVASLLIVPALADLYRYFVPDSRFAPWVSLTSKLTAVGISFTF
jgi:hypothetical protein